jgi:hypothetical protein
MDFTPPDNAIPYHVEIVYQDQKKDRVILYMENKQEKALLILPGPDSEYVYWLPMDCLNDKQREAVIKELGIENK